MAGTPLLADGEEGYGRARLARVLLTVALPPLLCGISLGLTYGNIGGVLENAAFQRHYNHPSDKTVEPLAAVMQAGCVVGSIGAGWLADGLGRRTSILVSMVLVALASLIVALPLVMPGPSFAPLFVGRALSGVGGGIACSVIPLHASESAPAEQRGSVEV